jgi:hypothetical protein
MLRRHQWLCASLLGTGLTLTGPAHGQEIEGGTMIGAGPGRVHCDRCANIPPGVQPAPPGTYVNKFIHVQAAKAETDDFVLYKHMWFNGGTELGPLGRYQLDLITRRLPTVPFPVVIETSKDDQLDSQRRGVIVALLRARGFTDPDRVIVAYPIAEGLRGDEAVLVYNGLINLGAGLGGGGFGPGGLGGLGGLGFPGFGLGTGFGGLGVPGLGFNPGFGGLGAFNPAFSTLGGGRIGPPP